MGTTTIHHLPYPELAEPADVPADIRELADAVDPLLPQLVATLPASPADGAEVYYVANAAAGVVWHLRYRAAATGSFKWEFVGGSGLQSYVPTLGTTTVATYGDLASAGPTVTLPLAGEYEIQHMVTAAASGAGISALQSIAIGAAAAVDADALYQGNQQPLSTGNYYSLASAIRRYTVTAGAAITCKYRTSTAGQVCNFQLRSLRAVPVRVG